MSAWETRDACPVSGTRVERVNVTVLGRRTGELRDLLVMKGWAPSRRSRLPLSRTRIG